MSTKKDKFIESAQKLIIKGQLEKAVVDLEQAVALDPGDLKVRQKLAETLVRVNRQSEAVSHYETIGKSFSNSGFYLKAIAVYKQIQKLDPDNTKITLTLAELNVNHGLIGNALSEFSQVVNIYLKTGKQAEALQLLERMLEIDPANLNTMLKMAETALVAGNIDNAYNYYCQLAQQLWERPDKTPYLRLAERIKTLFPDKEDPFLSSVSTMLERGDTAGAYASLKTHISQSPDNLDAWHLMAATVRSMGDTRQLRVILSRISERFPDEAVSKEELINLALTEQEIDTAVALLGDFRQLLLDKGCAGKLESFYTQLQTMAPLDSRPLEGLCWLYEKTGNPRLNTTREQIAKLSKAPAETATIEEAARPIMAEEPAPPAAIESPVNEPDTEPPAPLSLEPEPIDWEEDIDLGLDEEPKEQPEALPAAAEIAVPEPEQPEAFAEPAAEATETEFDISREPEPDELAPAEPLAVEICEPEIIPEFVPEEPEEISLAELEQEEFESIPEEAASRVILTIENPLPVETFLMPAAGVVEPLPEPDIEPEQASPWDALNADEPLTGISPTSHEKSAVPQAEELVDLLVEHLESFDWGATETGTKAPASGLSAPEELEFEILTEHGENNEAPAFELEDLTSFTEALFGEEPAETMETADAGEYSLGSLLSAFRKGVDEQLDESDTESHYNLGIAYKEMGLLDEAIHEFRSAGRDPQRAADCISLQAICLRDKGDITGAEAVFKEGLDLPVLSSEALLNLKYELALLYELADRHPEAVKIYQEIVRINPSYRDVSLKLSHLAEEDDLDILIELKEEGD
ncbi:cellulose synthase subunit BcsC [Geobacter sp. OR-1]|uniref:tetratricopeptide repeat protein n=1 Tax=Geobacter sp. OR-1 TaxID=1266765 RepID=UPI000541F4A4|nr:tetratricopeptide repeat protein [Geobacter sp. OR-1]GAM10037.1 cellulose synthase subunit BcsC [Geobacter sp. OR-1]